MTVDDRFIRSASDEIEEETRHSQRDHHRAGL